MHILLPEVTNVPILETANKNELLKTFLHVILFSIQRHNRINVVEKGEM